MSENLFIVSVILKDRPQPINLYFKTNAAACVAAESLLGGMEGKDAEGVDEFGRVVNFANGSIQAVAVIDADLDFAAQEALAMKEARKQARIRNKMGSDPAFRVLKGMPIVGGNN